MILNQNETWDGQPGWVKDAFKGPAEKKLLKAGFKIYKFNGYPSLQPPGSPANATITGWWSPYEAFEWDGGLENRRNVAQQLGGATLKELSRIVVAVREDWSSLSYLISAELTDYAYVFFGSVAPQQRLAGRSLRSANERASSGGGKLLGSGSQFYIPNLTMDTLTNVNVENLG